jgi:hypothetical protein
LNLCHARQLIVHPAVNIVYLTPHVCGQPRLLPSDARSAAGFSDHAHAARGSVFHAVITAVRCASLASERNTRDGSFGDLTPDEDAREHHGDGHGQKQMNETADRDGADRSEEPDHGKDQGDCRHPKTSIA